jgi:predicted lipoprotein
MEEIQYLKKKNEILVKMLGIRVQQLEMTRDLLIRLLPHLGNLAPQVEDYLIDLNEALKSHE